MAIEWRLRGTVLAGLAMVLLGCTAVQPPSQTPAADGKPKTGGVFREPVTDDPFDFDMTYTGSSITNPYVIKRAYSPLLRFKTGPNIGYAEATVEPLIADRWEISPDVSTYTFHLRRGVKFADLPPVNGRELTSADVKWTFEYVARAGAFKERKLPTSRYDFFFEGLDSIQTPDPYTVVVKFKEPFAPFINYVATSENPIMPHEIYDQDGHFKEKIVGSGPFQLDTNASQKGSKWVFKKNPSYLEEGKPYLDGLDLIVMRDDATRQAAFKARQVDYYVGSRDATVSDEVKRSIQGAWSIDFTSTPAIIAPNFKRPPFDNLKVRLALSRALDRDELVRIVGGGKGGWAVAFSNVRDDIFTQDEIKTFVKYNQEEAKRLLAEAGYPNGVKAEMIYSSEGNEALAKGAELAQAQLKRAGFDLTLRPLNETEMTLRRRAFDCDICSLSEAQRADLDGQLFLAARSGGPSNYNQIADSKADALIVAQRREGNPEKRQQILREVLRYLNESGLAIATYRTGQAVVLHPYVKDFYENADFRTQGVLTSSWLDK